MKIDNSNVNSIARVVLKRINEGKTEEKEFSDLFDTEEEFINFMKMLKDCNKINNCSFMTTLNGNVFMMVNGHGGIKVTDEGIKYLNDLYSFIVL